MRLTIKCHSIPKGIASINPKLRKAGASAENAAELDKLPPRLVSTTRPSE
jgi:hypothetical protein